jgi:hypothetical protein
MTDLGKLLVVFAAAVALVGGALWLLGKCGYRGLPGDIFHRGEHLSFYFPIVTCLVLSFLLTLVLWLWQWLSRR